MVNHYNTSTSREFDHSFVESNESEPVEDPKTRDEFWHLYICESAAGYFYVGIAKDPQQRLINHNSGNGAKMASDQGGFKLKYVSPPFGSKSEARSREIQIKKWSRDKKLKLIGGEWV